MKLYLLTALLLMSASFCNAQNAQVNNLPTGKYETLSKSGKDKWERGDIILVNENQYRISTSNEIGEYKFSVTAQRVFFTSGPLKSLYAKTSLNNDMPAIVLPVAENQQQGLRLPSEIWGYYKN